MPDLEYKKYDYLNKKNTLIKIFVSYIKPAPLLKSEILTPIHLGRSVAKENSKSGKITDDDLNWLYENCIGDDDFDGNISYTNRRVGFLTGTYKAYMNYDKIGNPGYFGSFGYRRQFNPDFLEDLESYDCIIPYRVDFSDTGPTIEKHICKLQGEKMFFAIKNILYKIHPEEKSRFEEYLSMTSAYMYEIYVMKKDLFFEFCRWIFPLLFEFLKIPPEELQFETANSLEAEFIKETGEIRDIAYATEILTGYYCHKLNLRTDIKCKKQSMIFQHNTNTENSRNEVLAKLLRKNLIQKTGVKK